MLQISQQLIERASLIGESNARRIQRGQTSAPTANAQSDVEVSCSRAHCDASSRVALCRTCFHCSSSLMAMDLQQTSPVSGLSVSNVSLRGRCVPCSGVECSSPTLVRRLLCSFASLHSLRCSAPRLLALCALLCAALLCARRTSRSAAQRSAAEATHTARTQRIAALDSHSAVSVQCAFRCQLHLCTTASAPPPSAADEQRGARSLAAAAHSRTSREEITRH